MKFSKEPQKNNLDESKTYNGIIFDICKVKNGDYYDIKIKLLNYWKELFQYGSATL